ncbi:MAG: class I SAM-dependent methyltransferase [Anaerolineae bacterium]|nr:class I SAM-dependent methyltransferase [Anaerolineae bacterium]
MSPQALPIVPQSSDDPLVKYAETMLALRAKASPVDDVLVEMEEIAARDNIPIIGHLEGAILHAIIAARRPQPTCILEIGTATGYSAIWMARAVGAACSITSIEIDPERAKRAQHFIKKAGYEDRITVLNGNAFDILPTLDQRFEVIFQDVIKHAFFGESERLALELLDLLLDKLADNGMLLGDNAFCMGEVLHENGGKLPKQVLGIKAYNEAIARHPRLDSVIIPVRDGLWISNKR